VPNRQFISGTKSRNTLIIDPEINFNNLRKGNIMAARETLDQLLEQKKMLEDRIQRRLASERKKKVNQILAIMGDFTDWRPLSTGLPCLFISFCASDAPTRQRSHSEGLHPSVDGP